VQECERERNDGRKNESKEYIKKNINDRGTERGRK
jgi:hypothetical protein